MKAGSQNLRESYLLTAGFFDDGAPMDQEQMRDLLDLHCTDSTNEPVQTHGFDDVIARQLEELGSDVEDRNARFFLEQESLLDATRLDLKAKYDAQIREYQAKETTANKEARKASNAAQELKLKQEARKWRRKADEAEDDYRSERNRLRDESDELLDSAAEALEAKQSRHALFTINWEVR